MKRIYILFLIITYLMTFRVGEHIGGPEIFLFIIKLLDFNYYMSLIFELLGVTGLVLLLIFNDNKYSNILCLLSIISLWLSLIDYLIYYFSYFDFIGQKYIFVISVIPFLYLSINWFFKSFKNIISIFRANS